MYLVQCWSGISGEAIEDTLRGLAAVRAFVGCGDGMPDVTTLLRFRRMLGECGMQEEMFRLAAGRRHRGHSLLDRECFRGARPGDTLDREGRPVALRDEGPSGGEDGACRRERPRCLRGAPPGARGQRGHPRRLGLRGLWEEGRGDAQPEAGGRRAGDRRRARPGVPPPRGRPGGGLQDVLGARPRRVSLRPQGPLRAQEGALLGRGQERPDARAVLGQRQPVLLRQGALSGRILGRVGAALYPLPCVLNNS